jgi:rSAM/selenodomain-associated transferase 1
MKSKNSDNTIIIFQKNLIPGKVKTRLAATVGNQQALEIYKELVAFTHKQTSEVADADVWIFFSESIEEIGVKFQQHVTAKMVQEGSDLGERMHNAFKTIFGMGYKKAILIGTDCPEISPEILETALDSLQNNEAVIGPALDGGYYLVGMKKAQPHLFEHMPWSTENVFPLTLLKLNQLNISYWLLPGLSDIDTEEDWLNFKSLISETYE